MSLTLNSTLQTAQDGLEHSPICRVTSSRFVSNVPLTGYLFNQSPIEEQYPSTISTSSGRIAITYTSNDGNDIIFRYSDTERTVFSDQVLNTVDGDIYESTLIELSPGVIGIVYCDYYGGNYRLRYLTVDEEGNELSTVGNIESFASASYVIRGANLVQIDTGDILLVYSKEDVVGETYSLMIRSTSDFSIWGSESAISLSGLSASNNKSNPFLLETDNGLLLFFDYVTAIRDDGTEITNIYYAVSSDNGSTFAAPAALTNITSFGELYSNPYAAINSSGEVTLAYHLESTALQVDEDTTGYCTSDSVYCNYSGATDLHFDGVNNKLFVYNINTYTGIKAICSIYIIDVESWTVDKCYSTETTPAFGEYFLSDHTWWHHHKGAGSYACIGTYNNLAFVINHDLEEITEYYFENNSTWNLTRNVSVDFHGYDYFQIRSTWIDAEEYRFYVYFGNHVQSMHMLGYIDLTSVQDSATGLYPWTEIFINNDMTEAQLIDDPIAIPVKEVDMIMVACHVSLSNYQGALGLYTYGGALIKKYDCEHYSNFHWNGAEYPVYYDGHIYASFTYRSDQGQADRRGLMDINISTDHINYIVPTYGTYDNYYLWRKKSTGDGRIIISTLGYGIQIFNILDGSWTTYDNSTIPGLTPDGNNVFFDVEYDPVTGNIFSGCSSANHWHGAVMVNEGGNFKRGKYRQIIYTTDWTPEDEENLTVGFLDYDISLAVNQANDELWYVWTHTANDGENSLQWDREEGEIDITSYLEADVEVTWDIEGHAIMEFGLSHGHLFDSFNFASTLSMLVSKGRKITLEFGERIAGVDYFQNQGEYVIKGSNIRYSRNEYPRIGVSCESINTLWEDATITATEFYDGYPEDTLADLLETHASLTEAQYDLPGSGEMENSHSIEMQWLDESLSNIIKSILDHFGYYSYVNTNGVYTIKYLDPTASVDHSYNSLNSIISFTPDDSYATLTNRVVVKGEGLYFIEVTYAEELQISDAGSLGWWGCTQSKKYYYSEDRQKRCRNPRLVVTENPAINTLFVRKGGGSIDLVYEDPNGYYVQVTVIAPDLIELIVVAIALLIVLGAKAIFCDRGGSCGYYILALSIYSSAVMYILAAVANYGFEVYARGMGSERQTFQAEANDEDLQRELNLIISEEIEDAFCYTVNLCIEVARRELEIVKAQRRRCTFQKIAHLQDEIGDIISIVHPYSQQQLNILITNLKRTFSKATTSNDSNAGMIDSIEGWLLT